MKIFVFLLFSLIIFSCSSEEQIKHEDLQGRWELDSALRNGKDSPALEGVFFEFSAEQFATNFPYPNLGNTFSLEERVIILEGSPPLELFIKTIQDNTMTIEFSLEGSNFTLVLKQN